MDNAFLKHWQLYLFLFRNGVINDKKDQAEWQILTLLELLIRDPFPSIILMTHYYYI